MIKLLLISLFAFSKNSLHPAFPLLDKNGLPNKANPSIEQSCKACHDTEYIQKTNSHSSLVAGGVDCVDCHMPFFLNGKKIPYDNQGWVTHEWVENLSKPTLDNCMACHSSHSNSMLEEGEGLTLSSIVTHSKASNQWASNLTFTQGAIYSAEKISGSFINVQNKHGEMQSFDVHAQRQMNCTSCHTTSNNPSQNHMDSSKLSHLKFDIREQLGLSEYLEKPNHHFMTSDCRSCHQPLESHKKFPYPTKHLETVSCQSCHIPQISGPLLKHVNQAVVTQNGSSILSFWNTETVLPSDSLQEASQKLNTDFLTSVHPILLSKNGILSPYNIVETTQWLIEPNKDLGSVGPEKYLAPEMFVKIFWEKAKNKEGLLKYFDKNNDQQLSGLEMSIDSDEKLSFIKNVLSQEGYPEAEIVKTKSFIPVAHGVLPAKNAISSCQECHGDQSRFTKQEETFGTAFLASSNPNDPGLPKIKNYVLGTTRNEIIDGLGWLGFFGLLLTVGIHGGLRWYSSYKRSLLGGDHHENVTTKKIKLYGRYERVWHWALAGSTSVLLLTGFEIHYPGAIGFFGMQNATLFHNVAAAVFIINSIFSVFYYVTNSKVKQFIPQKQNLIANLKSQMMYYGYEIFRGPTHHEEKTMDSKFNPLQQLTYLGLLNILLPLQMVTGLLMWGVDKVPEISRTLDGYTYLGPVHTAGSWMFFLFLIIHVYLTTTGDTPLAHIKSMITGEEHVPLAVKQSSGKGESHE